MSNLNEVKIINIKDARPNMLLAEDVVTKTGNVIMAKNTMINNINFNKLMDNDIKQVKVWTSSIEESPGELTEIVNTLEEQMKPIYERGEYKSFEKSYELGIEAVKNNLLEIGSGAGIDIDSLYSNTTEIIEKVNCKSDVLGYLGYLRERDDHTFSHSINVALLCNLFSKWIGMDEEESKLLSVAGILHDIGKTKVDPVILNKKGKLTKEEFEEVKKHTYYGYKMVEMADISDEIKSAVLMHHEKIDGSGYPMGLKGSKITKFAKIVCICDIYDAMTSDRVYRAKICPFEVIRNFEQSSFGLLDTEYLLIFLQNIAYTYVGSWVKLSNGEIAEVVFINSAQLSKPIVKCNDEFIDLSQVNDLYIDHIV